jgi:hypothetical protein
VFDDPGRARRVEAVNPAYYYQTHSLERNVINQAGRDWRETPVRDGRSRG